MGIDQQGLGEPQTIDQNNNQQEKEGEMKKINISEQWTQEERSELKKLIEEKIKALEEEEQKLRETIKYEAPCFREIKNKKFAYEGLLNKLEKSVPAEFLEQNRRNFEEFVLHI